MRRFLSIVPVVALALAACSAGSTPSPSAASASPPAGASPSAGESVAPSESAAASGSPATGEVSLMVATSTLGQIVVDGKGRTLYAFTNDSAGTPTCYDACAANWPALLVSGTPVLGEGIEADDVTTVARTDGGQQLKFYQHPLYYFANDAAPGDTNGQGLSGKWFVVSPEGELVGM